MTDARTRLKSFNNQDNFCSLTEQYYNKFGQFISKYNLGKYTSHFDDLQSQFELLKNNLTYSSLSLSQNQTSEIKLVNLNYDQDVFNKLKSLLQNYLNLIICA